MTNHMLNESRVYPALIGIILFLGFYGTTEVGNWLRTHQPAFVEPPVARQKIADPLIYRLVSFGQIPLVVDAMLLRFLLEDQSISFVAKGAHPPSFYDLNLATDLDPGFFDLYFTGANYLAVIRNDGQGARDLLLKAEKFRLEVLPDQPSAFKRRYWSREFSIPFLLAYVYLFELNDIQKASEYFIKASEIERSPPYLKHLAKRFRAPGGMYEVGLELVKNLLEGEKTEAGRQTLMDKYQRLSLQFRMWKLNEDFKNFAQVRRIKPSQATFLTFLKQNGISEQDPMGGRIYFSETVKTERQFEKVLGLQ